MLRNAVIIGFVIVALALGGCSAKSLGPLPHMDWPMYMGNIGRTGSGHGKLEGRVVAQLKIPLMRIGSCSSNPVVGDGMLYFGTIEYTTCGLSLRSGRLFMQVTTGTDWVQATPAVRDRRVYVGAGDGIYAVNSTTQQIEWKVKTAGGTRSSPLVVGDTVYVGSEKLYAINAADGYIKWTAVPTKWGISSSPAADRDTVYVGSGDGKLYALDKATGHVRWAVRVGTEIKSTPCVVNGTVYVGAYAGRDGKLYAIDARNGHTKWQKLLGSFAPISTAFANGMVYAPSYQKLYAIEGTTGRITWTLDTGDWINTSPVVSDGIVYCVSNNAYPPLHATLYAVDGFSGKVKWTLHFETTLKSPAFCSNVMYVLGSDNMLYVIQ